MHTATLDDALNIMNSQRRANEKKNGKKFALNRHQTTRYHCVNTTLLDVEKCC